jgi:hypothetical protein
MVTGFATLFFAATGGRMIGIASLMGKTYSLVTIVMFSLLGFLAVYQRIKTGM